MARMTSDSDNHGGERPLCASEPSGHGSDPCIRELLEAEGQDPRGGRCGKGRVCQQESDGLEDAFWGSCAAAVAPCSCKLPVVLCTHVFSPAFSTLPTTSD